MRENFSPRYIWSGTSLTFIYSYIYVRCIWSWRYCLWVQCKSLSFDYPAWSENKRNATTLSQYIWKLNDKIIPYTLKWKIIARGSWYSVSTKNCNLCLKEKYFIICKPQIATLNNRNELASECRHRKKYLLRNLSY